MTSSDTRIKDNGFENWLRGALALNYAKQGLDDFISDEQTQFQKDLLAEVSTQESIPEGTVCNTCTTENVLPCPEQDFCSKDQVCQVHDRGQPDKKPNQQCPKNLCQHIRDGIRREHRFGRPSWKNTRADKWCTDIFEITKCYMPLDDYSAVTTIADTDFNGTLAVIINNKRFQSKLATDINHPNNVCAKAHEVGRMIWQATELSVSDKELEQYIDILTDLLSDPKYLAETQKASQAADRLKKLKSTPSIDTKDITSILEKVLISRNSTSKDNKDRNAWPPSQLIIDMKRRLVNRQTTTTADLDQIMEPKAAALSALDVSEIGMKGAIPKTAMEKHTFRQTPEKTESVYLQQSASADTVKKDTEEHQMKSNLGRIVQNEEKERIAITKPETQRDEEVIGEVAGMTKHFETIYDRKMQVTLANLGRIVQNEEKERIAITKPETQRDEEVIGEVAGMTKHFETIYDRKMQVTLDDLQEWKKSTMQAFTAIKTEEIRQTKKDEITIEKEMKEDFIAFYRERYSTIQIAPLVEEHDVPLVDLYVEPTLTFSNEAKSHGYLPHYARPRKHLYRDLFLRNDGEICQNIFITAQAGTGKTSFVKRLCMAWCQAHSPVETLKLRFAPADIEIMKQFEFLFMLSLRDFRENGACSLVDLIYIHIITKLDTYRRHRKILLEKILLEKRTLVVLDGLDEWTHPKFCNKGCRTGHEMPHVPARSRCTVLATTRPWKLGMVKPHMSQIDRQVEINELDKPSSEQLASNALTILNNGSLRDQSKTIEEFQTLTASMDLDTQLYIPYILLQMLCVWCDGLPFGGSKFERCTTIIELMLARGLLKLRKNVSSSLSMLHRRTLTGQATEKNKTPFPSSNTYCIEYYEVLCNLGKVAFESLFTLRRKSSLVFDSYVVTENISDDMLQFCLRIGLISLSRDNSSVSVARSTFSFPHRYLHEYFAALFMNARSEYVQERIFEDCTYLEALLDMPNVFVFLCGINSETCDKLVKTLYYNIQKDSISKNCLRYTLLANVMPEQILYLKNIKSIQLMQTEIVQEIAKNRDKRFDLYIDAVTVDNTIKRDSYQSLSRLIEVNKSNIKSLSITELPPTELTYILPSPGLHYPLELHKLDIRTEASEQDLHHLLSGSRDSLTCLGLDFLAPKKGVSRMDHTLSSRRVKEILEMKHLQSLGLIGLCMTHSDIEELMQHLNASPALIEITIIGIDCSEHKGNCSGYTLDLSQHKTLATLQLHSIALTQLDINSTPLETLMCGHLSTAARTSGLKCLLHASNLYTFSASESSAENLLETFVVLPVLVRLREVSLHYADLGDRTLSLPPEMSSLEYVWFYGIRMKSSSLRKFISSVDVLTQPVRIMLQECTITPTEEYNLLKNDINSSRKYNVLIAGKDKLAFQTTDADSQWKACIQNKDEEKARLLLQKGSLPNKDELQDVYIIFKDEHPELVKEACRKVEKYIKNAADNIIFTQASYEPDRQEQVVFVVLTSEKNDNVLDIEYPCRTKVAKEGSEEGDEVTELEIRNNVSFDNDVYRSLLHCLQTHSEDLMEHHSNLTNISLSNFISSKRLGLQEVPCIVFYVFAKGCIPIGETPLPKYLKSGTVKYPTDVREGRFASPNGGPTAQHKDLKAGCRIESSSQIGIGGTIGAFVKHSDHGICAITCAHVVLGISEFKKLYKGETTSDSLNGIQCFQPQQPNICGEVVDIRLFKKKKDRGGMDIAFVKVDEERRPKTEEFPDILASDLNGKRTPCIEALMKRKLQYNWNAVAQAPGDLKEKKDVVKYGQKTILTAGKIRIWGVPVRLTLHDNIYIDERKSKLKQQTFTYWLNDQIEIHDDGMEFATHGDSGAMVFIKDENNKLTALGILTGRTSRISYVTPIWNILEEIESPIPYCLAEISTARQILELLERSTESLQIVGSIIPE